MRVTVKDVPALHEGAESNTAILFMFFLSVFLLTKSDDIRITKGVCFKIAHHIPFKSLPCLN